MWRAQRDSNPQSSPSEGDALSSSAMGTRHNYIFFALKCKYRQGSLFTFFPLRHLPQ